jgi:hypothetical protein
MDQNEKLAMFGATHVIAVHGFSSCVTSHTTMPIKNNCLIYEEVYRYASCSITKCVFLIFPVHLSGLPYKLTECGTQSASTTGGNFT